MRPLGIGKEKTGLGEEQSQGLFRILAHEFKGLVLPKTRNLAWFEPPSGKMFRDENLIFILSAVGWPDEFRVFKQAARFGIIAGVKIDTAVDA